MHGILLMNHCAIVGAEQTSLRSSAAGQAHHRSQTYVPELECLPNMLTLCWCRTVSLCRVDNVMCVVLQEVAQALPLAQAAELTNDAHMSQLSGGCIRIGNRNDQRHTNCFKPHQSL